MEVEELKEAKREEVERGKKKSLRRSARSRSRSSSSLVVSFFFFFFVSKFGPLLSSPGQSQ